MPLHNIEAQRLHEEEAEKRREKRTEQGREKEPDNVATFSDFIINSLTKLIKVCDLIEKD